MSLFLEYNPFHDIFSLPIAEFSCFFPVTNWQTSRSPPPLLCNWKNSSFFNVWQINFEIFLYRRVTNFAVSSTDKFTILSLPPSSCATKKKKSLFFSATHWYILRFFFVANWGKFHSVTNWFKHFQISPSLTFLTTEKIHCFSLQPTDHLCFSLQPINEFCSFIQWLIDAVFHSLSLL